MTYPKDIKRLNYFHSQFLNVEDFHAEQAYHVALRHLHNRALHRPGVVEGGLQVTRTGDREVQVGPGMAIDRDGQEIVLAMAALCKFDNFGPSATAYVVIRAKEVMEETVSAGGLNEPTRIAETAAVESQAAAPPEDGTAILLARVIFDAQAVIAQVDQTVRTHAGAAVSRSDQPVVRGLTVTRDAGQVLQIEPGALSVQAGNGLTIGSPKLGQLAFGAGPAGLGLSGVPARVAPRGLSIEGRLDLRTAARTEGTNQGRHAGADQLAFYVTADMKADAGGVEFRHSSGAQGIGFGATTIYATGTNQDLRLSAQGNGVLALLGHEVMVEKRLRATGEVTAPRLLVGDGESRRSLLVEPGVIRGAEEGNGLTISAATSGTLVFGEAAKGNGLSGATLRIARDLLMVEGRLDLRKDTRSEENNSKHAEHCVLYVTGPMKPDGNGFEIRHSDGCTGIGLGCNTIYATGSAANQPLRLKPRGDSQIELQGPVTVEGTLTLRKPIQQGDWQSALSQGFGVPPGYPPAAYLKDSMGFIHLRGWLTVPLEFVDLQVNTVIYRYRPIFIFPGRAREEQEVETLWCRNFDGAMVRLTIGPGNALVLPEKEYKDMGDRLANPKLRTHVLCLDGLHFQA